jgi:T-complex protein 1 subunit beta
MHQPQRVEKAKILIANTPMDTDKIKVFGSRVKVDNIAKVSVCVPIAYVRFST